MADFLQPYQASALSTGSLKRSRPDDIDDVEHDHFQLASAAITSLVEKTLRSRQLGFINREIDDENFDWDNNGDLLFGHLPETGSYNNRGHQEKRRAFIIKDGEKNRTSKAHEGHYETAKEPESKPLIEEPTKVLKTQSTATQRSLPKHRDRAIQSHKIRYQQDGKASEAIHVEHGRLRAQSEKQRGIEWHERVFEEEATKPFSPSSLGEKHHLQALDIVKKFEKIDFDYDMPLPSGSQYISTILFEHQKEALYFIIKRECATIEDGFSLWKAEHDDDGSGYYRHAILRSERSDILPHSHRGGLLADEMGLGKTLTMLAAIVMSLNESRTFMSSRCDAQAGSEQQSLRRASSTLVIVPSAALLDSWIFEILKHVRPGLLKTYKYHGTGKNITINSILNYDVVITTYATLAADIAKEPNLFQQIMWFRVVLDEAHTVRNQSTKQFQAVYSLQAERHWCLTGTPIQNGLQDLGSLIRFLRVSPFDSNSNFRKFIYEPLLRNSEDGNQNLRLLLRSMCLRRTRNLLNLPKPEIQTVIVSPSMEERDIYSQILGGCRGKLDDCISTGAFAEASKTLLKTILSLRLLCNNGTRESWDSEPSLACARCSCEFVTPNVLRDESSSVSAQNRENLLCPTCLSSTIVNKPTSRPAYTQLSQHSPHLTNENLAGGKPESDKYYDRAVESGNDKDRYDEISSRPSAAGETSGDTHIDFSTIESFLVSNSPFERLQEDLKERIYYDTGAVMQDIDNVVVSNMPSTSLRSHARFMVEWKLSQCLNDQYGKEESIENVLLLVGTDKQAYTTRCSTYLEHTWPLTGSSTLRAINTTLKEGSYSSGSLRGPIKSIALQNQPDDLFHGCACVTVSGSTNELVEIAQQLSLLAASIRVPISDALCHSETTIRPRGISKSSNEFRLELSDLQAVSNTGHSCWHPLFAGSVMARGFPTPPRSGEVGIEIPYSLMTSLSRILYPVQFDGGLLLKGFSTMLVPIKCSQDSIQWHFISGEEKKRLPTGSVNTRIKEWCRMDDSSIFSQRKAFLGWCKSVKVHLGTRDANYESVDYSTRAKRIGRKMDVSGGTMSIASPSHGLPNLTLGANYVLSKNQAMTKNLINESYLGILEAVKEMPMILYDVDDRKAWFVSAISAVLHMMHIWARKRPSLVQFEGRPVELPFAEASWNGGQAALDAINGTETSLLKLHGVPGAEPYRLMDLVMRLWGNLESAIDTMENQKPAGFRLESRRNIRGWELMDMSLARPLHRPKECHVERTGGTWHRLTEDVMTLFCSGLGEAIKPGTHEPVCPGWSTIPLAKDYMAASLVCVTSLSATSGKSTEEDMRLTDRLVWSQRSSCEIFGGCKHGQNESCELLQDIKELTRSKFHAFWTTQNGSILELPQEGAVVFGKKTQLTKHARLNNPSMVCGQQMRAGEAVPAA